MQPIAECGRTVLKSSTQPATTVVHCGAIGPSPMDDGVVHRKEEMLVEAFVPHPPLKALGEGVSRVGLPGAM